MSRKKFTVDYFKSLPKFRQKSTIKRRHKFKNFVRKKKKMFMYQSFDPKYKYCSIKNMYDKSEISDAEKAVQKQKSKKNKKVSLIFFIINVIIIGGIITYSLISGDLSLDNFPQTWQYQKYLLVALIMFFVCTLIDSLKYVHLIYLTTKRFRPFLAYKTNVIGSYYDNVTPLATGGQPFQIYYLNKRGVKGDAATSIPMSRYVFWQIAHVVFSSLMLIFNGSTYFSGSPLVVSAATIGLIINGSLMLIILFLSVSKRVGPRFVIGILKFLAKIKIIKNYQLTFRKVMKFVVGYQKCMKSIVKKPITVIIQLLLAFLGIIAYCSIAYFVYLAFYTGTEHVQFIEIVVKVIVCQLAVSFIPTPGSTGAAEYSFYAMFVGLLGSNAVIAMVMWRLLTYFIALFQGIIVLFYDVVIGNRKAEKLERIGYFKNPSKLVKQTSAEKSVK